jgi:hypothetical protein
MMTVRQATRDKMVLLLFSTGTSVLFLLLSSTCSPLYVFNDWADPNSFLTVGKVMIHGLVPYRDLFEQKGPLVYLLHGVAYLLDRTGFGGVFLFEVLSLTLTLYVAGRTVVLFLDKHWQWFILPVCACLPLLSSSFEGGDSAEEFCFPLIVGLLYLALRYYKVVFPAPMPALWLVAAGAGAGCVFMTKYTLLGCWFGFSACLIWTELRQHHFQAILRDAALFLLGLAAAIAPWLVYFLCNQALDDFVQVYIVINISAYADQISLMNRLLFIGASIITYCTIYLPLSLPGLYGMFAFTRGRLLAITNPGRLLLLLCGLCLSLSVFWGGRSFIYYYLAFSPFLLYGLIALADRFGGPVERKLVFAVRAAPAVLCAGALSLALVVLTLGCCPNIPLMQKKAADYPQLVFARIINQIPDATLLNYNFIDGGFYTAAGIVPNTKYFMLNNIRDEKLPEMRAEQSRYILDTRTTFVVLRSDGYSRQHTPAVPGLHEKYSLVASMESPYRAGAHIYRYDLYQLRTAD